MPIKTSTMLTYSHGMEICKYVRQHSYKLKRIKCERTCTKPCNLLHEFTGRMLVK